MERFPESKHEPCGDQSRVTKNLSQDCCLEFLSRRAREKSGGHPEEKTHYLCKRKSGQIFLKKFFLWGGGFEEIVRQKVIFKHPKAKKISTARNWPQRELVKIRMIVCPSTFFPSLFASGRVKPSNKPGDRRNSGRGLGGTAGGRERWTRPVFLTNHHQPSAKPSPETISH